MVQTKRQKIGAPLAAFYLLNGTTFISSHDYGDLQLYKYMELCLETTEAECNITLSRNQDGTYSNFSVIDDYMYRPLELENVSLDRFTEWYKCLKRKNGRDFPENSYEFHSDHREVTSKFVVKRSYLL